MQIQSPTGFPEAIPVHLNTMGETPSVYLRLDRYSLVVQSVADADMLLSAATEARRLLAAAAEDEGK